jgi:D-serine deaminase-like pyridoxal phosphate-dependent protein
MEGETGGARSGVERQHKGLPLPDGVGVEHIAELGWNALNDLETPVMLLHEEAVEHNIATMARYVDDAGVLLAPHSKTSLSRAVVERQLAAGAWGMTAATVGQVRALHSWGVRRILLANVLVDPAAIGWVARTLLAEPQAADFWCYVDSPACVDLLEHALASAGAPRPLNVLLELGYDGGRTGARTAELAQTVARAAHESPRLRLSGVAGYEGLMHHDPDAASPAGLRPFLDELGAAATSLAEQGLFDDAEPLVTAGGSSYFDVVCERLGPSRLGAPFRTVLRSGCYVSHDHGMYQRTSPLDGRAPATDGPRFRPALELVAHVLSTPEPGLAIVGFGRRDVPTDDQLPVLLGRYDGGRLSAYPPIVVTRLNDQHAYLRGIDELGLAPGDLLSFGISHPCGAFDRWATLPVVDPDHRVVGVVTTDM